MPPPGASPLCLCAQSRRLIARLMTSYSRLLLGLLFFGTALFPASAPAQDRETVAVLVFSKTNEYRHSAIPKGIQALHELGDEHGFRVETTEDSTAFRTDRLSVFDVIVFLNTTGDVLGPTGETALRRFIQNGGGFVGVHAATDTEYEWNWYGRLIGTYFDGHPSVQTATIRPEAPSTPSTRMLSSEWVRRDEWYNFRSSPRDSVQVLLTLDETTYEGGTMGVDPPIAWRHSFDGGRAWYTAGGHTPDTYQEPLFRQHLLGGILWAGRQAK